MRCRACPKAAVVQVTEVLADDRFEVLHFCQECGHRYLAQAPGGPPVPDADDFDDLFASDPDAPAEVAADLPDADEPSAGGDPGGRVCEVCGLKFVEFRNSGRLGCPHDYDQFREELLPLLESIHGDTKHDGKLPRGPSRSPAARPGSPSELPALRKKLTRAVRDEDYEAAARLRDRIRELGGL